MEALADAAADDREVELAYRALVQTLHRGHRQAHRGRDRRRQHACRSTPQETARALVLDERELPADRRWAGTRRVEPARVVDTLTTIWTRTLYGDRPTALRV